MAVVLISFGPVSVRLKWIVPRKLAVLFTESPDNIRTLLTNLRALVESAEDAGANSPIIPEILYIVEIDQETKRPKVACATESPHGRHLSCCRSHHQGVRKPN